MKNEQRQTYALNRTYFLQQVMFWGGAVVLYAYKTQILSLKGYTAVEIGILNSVELIAGAFFQIWIGNFADRHAGEQ